VLSQLYIATAALRCYELSDGDASDGYLLDWVMADSLHRAQNSLEAVCRNLSSPWLARVIRRLIFPYGRPWPPPDDRLERRLADLLTVPSTGRDKLTAGIYLPGGSEEPLARLETALGKVSMTASLAEKLREGARMELVGTGPFQQRLEAAVESRVLTPAEADELRYAEQARQRVLLVDAMAPDPDAA
jgi:acyl-CoA dehydrogenase